MSPELEEYTSKLEIFAYRMNDSSLVLAEEVHRDIDEEYIVISRPLQVLRSYDDNHTIKTTFIPWMIGETSQLRVYMESIQVTTEATVVEKLAYCQYFILNNIKAIMAEEDLSFLLSHGEASAEGAAPASQAKAQATMLKSTLSIPPLKDMYSGHPRIDLN